MIVIRVCAVIYLAAKAFALLPPLAALVFTGVMGAVIIRTE